jgi:(1->4)-alpha-D-glucan 1-alpha-D-glucosylmutase
MIPRATYRLQFHKDFTFADAIRLLPYFKTLGISHLYSSPILAARAGSEHGYDVIDHTRINPELGGEVGFRAFAQALRQHDLGLIVDIVPNHMAVGGADNPWWLDVLEKGHESPYAIIFDIDWDSPDAAMRGKILLPFLGKPVEEVLAAGELKLVWDATLEKFAFAYFDHRFPLRREDYTEVTAGAAEPSAASLEPWNNPESLATLLARQHFVLAFWQVAPDSINWRSFFDVTGLAALRIEDERVFEAVHAKLFQLYAEGLIDGLRVDHVDGLTDPRAYCRRLRARLDALASGRPADALPGPAYLILEKILAQGEQLPADWKVDGTTGYDFMNDISALQHDANGKEPLTRRWTAISGRAPDFETEEREARRELIHASFECHWRATAAAFHRLALFAGREVSAACLAPALEYILIHFRAYRTYATGDATEPPPGELFEAALDAARNAISVECLEALEFIASAMRGQMAEFGKVAHEAVRHFNQLAAPVAAKAVEDTAFFRYGRLLSRNDVGFAPAIFATSAAAFHASTRARQVDFPHALLATATHDHKRGEDVRARLAVLSECPLHWEEETARWFELNARFRSPEVNAADEYQLYQTLAGTWPADFTPDDERIGGYVERILGWREKSLREAKLGTSWKEPNVTFEQANAEFVRAILDPLCSRAFLARLAGFVERIAPAGALNGLGQCILRCTAPGVPDLYQGAEFWDLSLTDPDNRRAVDFDSRSKAIAASGTLAGLLPSWKDGHVKQALIARLLDLRAQRSDCFAQGDYVPLTAEGPRGDNVLGFARNYGGDSVVVAVPRLCAGACMKSGAPLPAKDFWRNTKLVVAGQPRAWRSALEPARKFAPAQALDCGELFAGFPGAVLLSTA